MYMTISPVYRPSTPSLLQWIGVGFLAGAVSVLFFHQGAVTLAHLSGLTQRVPYALQPTEPFGVPYVWSIVFWGGLWGALFAAMLTRLDGVRLVAAALLLGAVLPTLVAWFVVAPLKGQPMAANFQTTALASGVILNAAWGFGTGLGLALFGGRRVERRRTDRRITAMERRRLDRRRPIAA